MRKIQNNQINITARTDSGSTLIELLISITIVGVILVIIMGAFRIGIRAWETGEKGVESDQRQQIVLSIIKRQLSSACWYRAIIDEKETYYFRGDGQSIDFISNTNVVPGNNTGFVRVSYIIRSDGEAGGQRLEIVEQSVAVVSKEEVSDDPPDPADRVFYEIIKDVYSISFEYLNKLENESEAEEEEEVIFQWQPEWHDESDTGLPVAVKCILQMDEQSRPVTVIARILSEEEKV